MIPPKAEQKIKRYLKKLREWRYTLLAELPLEMAETEEHFRAPSPLLQYHPAPVGCTFGKHWGSTWFQAKVEIPKAWKGKRIYYRHKSAAEKMLFVDGAPFAGLDWKHLEVLLLGPARGGETLTLHIEAYAGHPFPGVHPLDGPPRTLHSIGSDIEEAPPLILRSSSLMAERESVTGLYYDADTLFRTAMILDQNSLRRMMLLDELHAALSAIPLHWESEEAIERAAKEARKALAPLLKKNNAPTSPQIGIVGHAHIDVGWLWPVRETIRKTARTFSTALHLMDQYPAFRFLQSQPALYAMMEEHYPEVLSRLRKRVKEGRWEPNGGMWVEADCNVSGGEALVRQFLEGNKKNKALFGYRADTLWLPDVFGYSAALPQILQQCGIKNFVTSKINWNDTNRFPYTLFWWQGIDRSEIFTHFITTQTNGYNGEVVPEIMQETWDYVRPKECQDSSLTSVGWGDGGGGPSRDHCEYATRMTDLEGCPKTEFVNASRFLERLRKQDVDRPRWVGELYLELHRGTYTSQARTKRYNRKLELLLREVEFLSALAMSYGLSYPAEALEQNWRVLLTNQFHDILPGSSIRRVYEVAEAEYALMEEDLAVLRSAALEKIGERFVPDREGKAWMVTNTLSWPREEVVTFPDSDADAAVDASGAPLLCQQSEAGLAVLVSMPALSVAPVALRKKGSSALSPFQHTSKTLESPHYLVSFDKAGSICSLLDKAAQREVVREGKRLNEIVSAEDIPVHWDAWDIDRDYVRGLRSEERLLSREVVEEGPLFLRLRLEYAIAKASTMTQDLIFYAHSKRIDFCCSVDWREEHTLLKVRFGVDVLADSCRHEIQFGHVERPCHENTSWDQARFESCAHKWIDRSESDYGVALLNDCKYGHDTLDEYMTLSLLKSPLAPDEIADQGKHEFTYALLPHTGNFAVKSVVREAYQLNAPLSTHAAQYAQGSEKIIDLCSLSDDTVIVEAVKKAEEEDALILRLYEAEKSRAKVDLHFTAPLRKAAVCNLMEEEDQPLRIRDNTLSLEMKPFEIKTLKIYFK